MNSKKDKGVNVNYLLNFSYESPVNARESVQKHQPFRRNLQKQSSQPFQKERFVQANYRFIVSSVDCDYSANLRDPDLLVEWDKIEQVCFYNQNESSCPICLDHPVAAKISKCGHIFCWVCVLHHLSYSQGNKQIGKCPICFAYISVKELKSCTIEPVKNFGIGDIIQFTLLKRSKESVVPLPINKWRAKTERYPMATDLDTVFSRIAIASSHDILDIIRREDTQLQEQAKAAVSEQDESLPFILQAQEYLAERQSKMEMILKLTESTSDASLKQSGSVLNTSAPQQTEKPDSNNNNGQSFDAWNTSFQSDPSAVASQQPTQTQEITDSSVPNTTAVPTKPSAPTQAPLVDFSETADFYYVYQASSGQQAILHPLDVKILLNEFGSFDKCPDTIEGKIMEIECEFQNDKLRKKYKFLGHLPLNTSFEFVEIDLRKVVSRDAFRPYQDEMQKRIRKRQKILRQNQLEKQQEEAMIRRKAQSVINKKDFPSVAPEATDPTESIPVEATTPMPHNEPPQIQPQTAWGQPAPEAKSTPFLDALKAPKTAPSLITQSTPSKNTKSGKQYLVFSTSSSRSYK